VNNARPNHGHTPIKETTKYTGGDFATLVTGKKQERL
jgi:hypothetical protein